MSDSRTAGGMDRLPWLSDEPARKQAAPQRGSRNLTGWAVASVLAVAGLSFWLGARSESEDVANHPAMRMPAASAPPAQPPAVPQPEVRIAPEPPVALTPAPEVRPVQARQLRIAAPASHNVATADVVKQVSSSAASEPKDIEPAVKQAATAAPAAKAAPPAQLTPWPARVTQGAYGRLVQIGAYGSRIQAKRGWMAMIRAYPAVAHLSAVVVESRNSKARSFYRFQIGTTSQAHSEVLCQRMTTIHLSCAIIGLPWKAKVER